MTTEASVTFSSFFLTLTMRQVTWVPLGITVFPSTLIGSVRLAANVSPTLFLSVASVCLAAALIAVPFGKVIIVVGSAALAITAGFAASGFLAALTALLPALLLALLVASFEQPATVKTPAPAKTSQRFRWA